MERDYFEEIVVREAKGQATPEEAAWLKTDENLNEWVRVLQDKRADVEAQFLQRKAEAQDFQNQCHQMGPTGKSEWFEYKAQYDHWRSGARRWLQSIVNALNRAKQARYEGGEKADKQAHRNTLHAVYDALEDGTISERIDEFKERIGEVLGNRK